MSDTKLMLREAKRLYDLGFAIHWLKVKSKKPLNPKWTTGPRNTWEELKPIFREGLNVGVRLGEASEFPDGTFLAVIDCDVKSTISKHQNEMLIKLRGVIDDLAPSVSSGRGNGSQHIYIRTKKPIKPFKYTESSEKVLVHMPSVDPTPNELKIISEKEIKAGMRLRKAWEISIMGEGQQVVLPPSIHPDSGKAYIWKKPIERYKEIPLVDLSGVTPKEKTFEVAEGEKFEAVDVDLLSSNLPDSITDLIISGKGCDDRSASIFVACLSMCKFGFTDNQILSVLTDRDNYLGACAYDHTQSNNRNKAAQWLRKYSLAKARAETSAQKDFEEVVIEQDNTLTPEQARRQENIIAGEVSWREKIERSGDHAGAAPKSTIQNVHTILIGETLKDVFKKDEFLNTDHYTVNTPWGGRAGHELKDIDLTRIRFWLGKNYRFEPSKETILDAVLSISDANKFHPIRDYLNGLEWDGVPRIHSWLHDYLGASGPKSYLRAISRKTLIAMVARVMEPGCKFDHVLILEGKQGCGKSTAVRLLSEPWFSDANLPVGDKDAVLAMRLAWVMEIGEMASMGRAEVNTMKQFISQSTDRIRLPYGRLAESFPRQCIFIGTTNSDEYLKDTTGNRRFWPVNVKQCKFKELENDRDQLLAEAALEYSLGEKLYLEEERTQLIATREQAKKVFVDSWVDLLGNFLKTKNKNFNTNHFSICDLFAEWGPFHGNRDTRAEQMRAADSLRALGYVKVRGIKNGMRKTFWKASDIIIK